MIVTGGKPIGVGHRYLITLAASSFRSVMTFAAGLLLARELGPESYGSMLFLLGVSMAIRQLLDPGVASAFFTFLSQRQRSIKFVGYYFAWTAVQLILPLLLILVLLPESWMDAVWKGHGKELAAYAFIASFAQNGIWPTLVQMGESQRATRWVQAIGAVVVFFNLIAIFILSQLSLLTLSTVFSLTFLEYLCAALVSFRGLRFPPAVDSEDFVPKILQEYWKYCRPLVLYSWLGFVFSLSDSWLLQHFAGSSAQAHYGIGAQFALFAAILVGAAQNILWKELAEAKYLGQIDAMARQYRKVGRVLYFVSAAIGGFFMFWSVEMLGTIWGGDYVAGALAFSIMCMYPAQLAMGNIETTVLMATGRARIQATVGNWFMVSSMVVAYFLLAPMTESIPGLGLADIGMAIKMVVMATIQVNIMAFLNSRYLGLKYDWIHQIVCISSVVVVGGTTSYLAKTFILPVANMFWAMGFSFIVYLTLLMMVLIVAPWLVDLKRSDLIQYIVRT